MKTLDEIFNEALQDAFQDSFSFPVVGANLTKIQLEKKGIVLTDQQIDELKKKLENISGDTINFDFDLEDEQNKALGLSEDDKIEIDIGEEQELDKPRSCRSPDRARFRFDRFNQRPKGQYPRTACAHHDLCPPQGGWVSGRV